jgi:hypothetical protein
MNMFRLSPRSCVLVLATGFIWLTLMSVRHITEYRGSGASAGAYFVRDPYCMIDPTCVSPLYKAGAPIETTHWEGSRWFGDGYDRLLVEPNGLYYLSPVNYAAFLALLAVGGAGAGFIRRAGARRNAVAALLTWTSVSIITWFGITASLSSPNQDATVWLAALFTWCMTAGLLLGAVKVGRASQRRYQRH